MIKFILSYDGANHAILCLQMRFMRWDIDIVHRNDHYIMVVDYWSHRPVLQPTIQDLFWHHADATNQKPSPNLVPYETQKHALLPWATSHTTQHH
jgi:hypothetical protein